MSILVTGASGFLGSRVVARLAAAGRAVTATARGPVSDQLVGVASVRWIERDLAAASLDATELAGIETVIHLAASAIVTADQDEWQFLLANEATTVRLLRACAGRVKKVIFASSQVVYGDANHTAVTEAFPLDGRNSAYACSKINAENWLRWFQKRHGGTYLALRFSGIVSSRAGGGAVDYIIDRALQNQPVELYSEGAVQRDYVSPEDAIAAVLGALDRDVEPGFAAINVGAGRAVTSLELARAICAALESSSEIVLSQRPALQRDFVLDVSKAIDCLGYAPGDLLATVRHYALRRKQSNEGSSRDA